jgi:DNA polymerase-3 subunit alpha (Gram-positive type)
MKLSEVITCRDDIMIYLMRKGIDNATAFHIMESIRKGKSLKQS